VTPRGYAPRRHDVPYFHIWFATKGRRRLLQEGDILDAVRELLPEIAAKNSIGLVELEATIDHVHLLLKLDDESELPRTMMLLKGTSSRRVFQRFPELRLDAHTSNLWQTGYGSKIIPSHNLPATKRYIRTQWERLESFQ
jgi:putative transposase